MWRSRERESRREVTCIACGDAVPRSKAREYDKYGDRWDRRDKEFEYLCKPCDRQRCHQPRGELESLLADAEAEADAVADTARATAFVRAYLALAEECDSSVEER